MAIFLLVRFSYKWSSVQQPNYTESLFQTFINFVRNEEVEYMFPGNHSAKSVDARLFSSQPLDFLEVHRARKKLLILCMSGITQIILIEKVLFTLLQTSAAERRNCRKFEHRTPTASNQFIHCAAALFTSFTVQKINLIDACIDQVWRPLRHRAHLRLSAQKVMICTNHFSAFSVVYWFYSVSIHLLNKQSRKKQESENISNQDCSRYRMGVCLIRLTICKLWNLQFLTFIDYDSWC